MPEGDRPIYDVMGELDSMGATDDAKVALKKAYLLLQAERDPDVMLLADNSASNRPVYKKWESTAAAFDAILARSGMLAYVIPTFDFIDRFMAGTLARIESSNSAQVKAFRKLLYSFSAKDPFSLLQVI